MYVYRNGKNQDISVSDRMKQKFTLNEKQIKKLCELGTKIENHYGYACDIEWAFENENFYIVQSRPVTTL